MYIIDLYDDSMCSRLSGYRCMTNNDNKITKRRMRGSRSSVNNAINKFFPKLQETPSRAEHAFLKAFMHLTMYLLQSTRLFETIIIGNKYIPYPLCICQQDDMPLAIGCDCNSCYRNSYLKNRIHCHGLICAI